MRSWMHSRKAIVVGSIAAATVIGGATMAAANQPAPSASTASAATSATPGATGADTETKDGPDQSDKGDKGETPDVKGSIKAPETKDDAKGAETAASQQAEDAALAKLATVDKAAATSAATGAVPGTAGPATLQDEDGSVVYKVEVTKADKSVVEVTVDAGNASVLGQDASDGAEGPEGSGD